MGALTDRMIIFAAHQAAKHHTDDGDDIATILERWDDCNVFFDAVLGGESPGGWSRFTFREAFGAADVLDVAALAGRLAPYYRDHDKLFYADDDAPRLLWQGRISRLIETLGGQVAVAERIGCTQGAVSQWATGSKLPTGLYAKAVREALADLPVPSPA